MDILKAAAATDQWWRDVLDDNSLIIGIRDDYFNVYWNGQAIYTITFSEHRLHVSTHVKYLLDPSISKQVTLVDGSFAKSLKKRKPIISEYDGAETLKKLKRAANYYSKGEKVGVHAIAQRNGSVVDVEIVFSATGEDKGEKLPRADIAAFEQEGDHINLVFWEAKLFANPELWKLEDKKSIVKQIERYRTAISMSQPELISSYKRVALNLKEIAEMGDNKRTIHPSIADVADAKIDLRISSISDVGLIVFDYDLPQKDIWIRQRDMILSKIDNLKIRANGTASQIKL